MSEYMSILIVVCPMVFLAGFVDSIAGGGGLISLPAYIFAGLPIHMAYGTNKFASCLGTVVSTAKFLKSGHINVKPALISSGGALIGSWLGAQLVLMLDEKYLQYCLIFILPLVAVFLLLNRKFGSEDNVREVPTSTMYPFAFLIGLTVGAYDGFFGPGAGTFYVLGFTAFLGFNLITSSGNAKMVNLASNLAALLVYIPGGKVMYAVAIPAAICSIAGNFIGSHLAIKNGAKFIKPIIVVVIFLLFAKVISGLF